MVDYFSPFNSIGMHSAFIRRYTQLMTMMTLDQIISKSMPEYCFWWQKLDQHIPLPLKRLQGTWNCLLAERFQNCQLVVVLLRTCQIQYPSLPARYSEGIVETLVKVVLRPVEQLIEYQVEWPMKHQVGWLAEREVEVWMENHLSINIKFSFFKIFSQFEEQKIPKMTMKIENYTICEHVKRAKSSLMNKKTCYESEFSSFSSGK